MFGHLHPIIREITNPRTPHNLSFLLEKGSECFIANFI